MSPDRKITPKKKKGRTDHFTANVRRALADYMYAEGCSCCRDQEKHDEAAATLGKLLRVPRHKDRSGYDFSRFRTKVSK